MGRYARAILVFGVDCGIEESPWADEEFAEDDENPGELEEGLYKQAGLVSPYTLVPDEINNGPYDEFTKWCKSNEEFKAAKEIWDAETAKIREANPFEIAYYGDSEWSSYIVHLKGFEIPGDWESVRKIEPHQLEVPDSMILEKAAAYAEEHGIKWGDPAWVLSASYG